MNEPHRPYPLLNDKAGSISISILPFGLKFRDSYRFWLIGLLLAFASSPLFASPESDWKIGNQFYAQKEYDSAAAYFEKIASGKPADATIYYNLGNTYYRLNNIGLAVLNYERALKRNPDYKEAADNLLLTQARIPGLIQPTRDIFFVRWWKVMTAPDKVMLWAIISLLFFIGLIGLLLYRRINKNKVYVRPQYIGALVLLWLTGLLLALSAAKSAISNVRAVIIIDNVSILREGAKGLVAVPQGTTVTVQSMKASAYQIATPDGHIGMVTKSQLAIVD